MTLSQDQLDSLFNGTDQLESNEIQPQNQWELTEKQTRLLQSEVVQGLQDVELLPMKHPTTGADIGKSAIFDNRGRICGGLVADNHNFVSKEMVQTAIIAGAEAFPDVESIKIRTGWRKGHLIEISDSDESRKSSINNDTLTARLWLHNALGGSGHWKAGLVAGRDQCDNLMMFRSIAGINFKIRHDNGLDHNFDAMVSDFRQLAAKWDNVLEVAEQMNQREVSLEQIVDTLELGKKEETQKKTITAIIGELDKELEIIGETATGSLMDRFKRPVNGLSLIHI